MEKSLSYLENSIQNCPLCGSDNFDLLNNNDRYNMHINTVGCKICGLIQSNPRPTENGLNLFYSRDYRRFYQNIEKPSESYINKTKKNDRMDYAVSYIDEIINLEKINSLLDFGCSEGAFFEALKRKSFSGQMLGVEPNKDFADFINKENNSIKVYSCIDDIDKSYDLVVLIHVFEHLLDPNIILAKLTNNLKIGGYIYIDVPDAEEYESLSSLHIAHVYHYTSTTLKSILLKSGFEILKCEKHNPPFHPKSIRLIARFDDNFNSKWQVPNFQNELNTWNKIKAIKSKLFLIKSRLSKISFLRKIYKMFKNN